MIEAVKARLVAAARLGKVEQQMQVFGEREELPEDPPEPQPEEKDKAGVKQEEEMEPDMDDETVMAEVGSLEEGLDFLTGDDEESLFDPEGDAGDLDGFDFDE